MNRSISMRRFVCKTKILNAFVHVLSVTSAMENNKIQVRKLREKNELPIEVAGMNTPHGKEHKVNIYSFFFSLKSSIIKVSRKGYQTKTGNQYVITASIHDTSHAHLQSK